MHSKLGTLPGATEDLEVREGLDYQEGIDPMTMTINHARVLVSNRGDGNWGITGTANQVNSADSIYFPHGASSTVAPSSTQIMGASLDHSAWGCKSNWIVQLDFTAGSGTIQVYAMRPTGIEELVLAATGDATHGGLDSEVIQGPVDYFRFVRSSSTPTASCFVIGWNEGDMNS